MLGRKHKYRNKYNYKPNYCNNKTLHKQVSSLKLKVLAVKCLHCAQYCYNYSMNIGKVLKQHWPLFIILFVAAVLRFWRLEELTTFGGDQGYDFLIVKAITEGKFTLLGPKIGPYNNIGNLYLGPAYYYLLAPWLILFKLDPLGPAIFTVLASLVTILLIYIIAAKYLSKNIAILASSLYGLDALLIEQSRATSNPHLIPLFASISIYSYLKTIEDKAKSFFWPVMAGVSIGIAFQLHYLAFSLFLTYAIFTFISKKFKALSFAVVGFMLSLSGEIFFEVRHGFFITNIFLAQLKSGHVFSPSEILNHIHDSLSLLNNNFFLGTNIIISLAFLALLYFAGQKNLIRNKLFQYLLTSILVGIVCVVIYPGQVSTHYFATIYVSLVLVIAAMIISNLIQKKSILLRVLATTIIILFFAMNIKGYNLKRQNGYTMPDGWNLKGIKIASKIVSNDIDSRTTFNIAATLDGDTRAMPYRYLLSVYGKNPLNVEQYPQADVLYLISRDNLEQVKEYTVWEVASFRPYNIIKLDDVQNGVSVYKLTKI